MIKPIFPNVTPSRVTALICRKRYYEEHVLKSVQRGDFCQNLAFGSAVHDALKLMTTPAISTPVANRNLEQAIQHAFLKQNYPNVEMRQEDIAKAIPIIARYLSQASEIDSILGTEIFAEFTASREGPRKLTFGAKFDALVARMGVSPLLVIRDYKTGRSGGVNLESACVTLAVAKVKLNQYRRDFNLDFSDVILEFDHLGEEGLCDRVSIGVKNVKDIWPNIKSRAEFVYSSTEFPPEPGEHCFYCPLRQTCQTEMAVEIEDLDAVFA